MRLLSIVALLAGVISWGIIVVHPASAQGTAYVMTINGDIDVTVPRYVKRVLAEAAEAKAAVVVIKIKTPGGGIGEMIDIKDLILSSKVPVIAFINQHAFSAGTYIALAASRIVMEPGSSIGAATPVYPDGTRASEKLVSAMRAEMRALAESKKRNPDLAEAMVDENTEIADTSIKKPGQLVSLTTDEAVRLGFCDLKASSLDQIFRAFGYGNPRVIERPVEWGENIFLTLTSPFISALLITLGLAGLFYGVKTGHIGTISITGLCCIAAFFGIQYTVDMAGLLELLLFIVGGGLIAVEIFVIPGFGVTGVLGIVMMFSGIFLALVGNRFDLISPETITKPLATMAGSMVALAVLVGLMLKYLPSSPMFKHLVLQNTARNSHPTSRSYQEYLGQTGTALSILRPAGIALLGDNRVDVITEGEFINPGEPLEVIRVEGAKVIVRRATITESAL